MDQVPMSVLNNASGALSLLTKARCVESYYFPPEHKYKYLYAWPVCLEKNEEILNWLKTRDIHPNPHSKVKSYSVDYSHYENLNKITIPELDTIRVMRDAIVGLILSQFPSAGIQIEAFWNKSDNSDRIVPATTSDLDGIREFSSHSDSMFGFHHPNEKYKYKIPAYAGEVIFQSAGLFKGAKIASVDRFASAGVKADKSGISSRLLVHKENKGHLLAVFQSTIYSVTRFTKDSPWVRELLQAGKCYHDRKHVK